MPTSAATDISKALQPLRTITSSLRDAREGQVPTGNERRKAVRALRSAGNATLPALMRSLASPVESESSWAYYLIAHLGGERVIERLTALLADTEAADETKARALGLLSDLQAPIPSRVALHDPEALLARSVRDLLGSLEGHGDLETAADLIAAQVPEPELGAFVAEILRHGSAQARPLVELLSAREHFSDETRADLRRLHAEAGQSRTDRMAAEALERGLAYLEAGRPQAARRKLTRYLKSHPDDPEAHSALGVCLLQLGDNDHAFGHLERAVTLEPDEPLHRWNLAAAAKQAERLGGAYLALREYLRLSGGRASDVSDGATDRVREARGFTRTYERMLAEAHPNVSLADCLRGEELFARAHAALIENRFAEAASGFESVLALMPRHYPSWGNLGASYLQLGRTIEAERALRRALELNPKYTPARRNLALIELH
jgi:Flp pilus assembly protein TadD